MLFCYFFLKIEIPAMATVGIQRNRRILSHSPREHGNKGDQLPCAGSWAHCQLPGGSTWLTLLLGDPWGLGASWKVLWVPWDRRSWNTGLSFFMVIANGCVYVGTVFPSASKWHRHPRGWDCMARQDCTGPQQGILSSTGAKKHSSWKHSWLLLTCNRNLQTTVLRIQASPSWTLVGVISHRKAWDMLFVGPFTPCRSLLHAKALSPLACVT